MKHNIIYAITIGIFGFLLSIGSWVSFAGQYKTASNAVPVTAKVIEIKDTDQTEPERDFNFSFEYEGKTYTYWKEYVVLTDVEVGDTVEAFVHPDQPYKLLLKNEIKKETWEPVAVTFISIACVLYFLNKKDND